MSHPLFGYRIRRGKVTIIEDEAEQVRAVLASPRRARAPALRKVQKTRESDECIFSRVRRIVSHAEDYKAGRPRCDMPADPALAICP